MPATIIPGYKLLLTYDIRPEQAKTYYHFVLKEFVPELETMGIYLFRVWHVAWGDYPVRQLEFVTESQDNLLRLASSRRFEDMETRLQELTTDYERKILPFRKGFQF
ncbi:MAG: hypothetical protein OXB89_06675 [Anaerolineaceae bacterium]|nr:hypothetical protein [Anaerolineaceae bacterium]